MYLCVSPCRRAAARRTRAATSISLDIHLRDPTPVGIHIYLIISMYICVPPCRRAAARRILGGTLTLTDKDRSFMMLISLGSFMILISLDSPLLLIYASMRTSMYARRRSPNPGGYDSDQSLILLSGLAIQGEPCVPTGLRVDLEVNLNSKPVGIHISLIMSMYICAPPYRRAAARRIRAA